MSTRHQNPADNDCTHPASSQDLPAAHPALMNAPAPSQTEARLQTIHELVRSGDYHVPAVAIAERMIERLMMGGPDRAH